MSQSLQYEIIDEKTINIFRLQGNRVMGTICKNDYNRFGVMFCTDERKVYTMEELTNLILFLEILNRKE